MTGVLRMQLELWREHAHKTLPVLMRATSMLVCGEDLGFLAPCVHPLMKELGLIGALCMLRLSPSQPSPQCCLAVAASGLSSFLSCTHSKPRRLAWRYAWPFDSQDISSDLWCKEA